MAYMKDSTGRRLDSFPVATKPATGLLRNRPTATGSMDYYFAADDCGGTTHQDVAPGKWRRVQPRGELASIINETTTNFSKTGALTTIYSLYAEVTTDEPRPVEVILQGGVQVGTGAETIAAGASEFCRVSIFENGVNIGSDYYYAQTIGSQRQVRVALRRQLIPGTLYKYQGYYGSQSTNVSVRTLGGMELKVVEL